MFRVFSVLLPHKNKKENTDDKELDVNLVGSKE